MANQTTGIGVAAQIAVDATAVTLSLSGTTTHQINPVVEDVAGTPVAAGTQFVLTAAAVNGVYTGTITGGASNAFVGETFVIAGFTNAANNGSFIVTASSATGFTADNANSVAETHAATATNQEAIPFTYVVFGFARNVSGTSTPIATVSSTGLITGAQRGQTVVEVSFPTFANSGGDVASTGNIMNGTPINKIYKEVVVTVTP